MLPIVIIDCAHKLDEVLDNINSKMENKTITRIANFEAKAIWFH